MRLTFTDHSLERLIERNYGITKKQIWKEFNARRWTSGGAGNESRRLYFDNLGLQLTVVHSYYQGELGYSAVSAAPLGIDNRKKVSPKKIARAKGEKDRVKQEYETYKRKGKNQPGYYTKGKYRRR